MKKEESITTLTKDVLFRDLVSVHTLAMRHIRTVAEEFRELGLGGITMDDLQQIAHRNFDNIKARYYKTFETEMRTVRHPLLRGNLMAGVDETYNVFKQKTEEALLRFQQAKFFSGNSFQELEFSNYSVDDLGNVQFTEKDKARLMDLYCIIKVETDEQKEYFDLMHKCHSMLSRLKEMHNNHNIGPVFSVDGDPGLYGEDAGDIVIASEGFVELIND